MSGFVYIWRDRKHKRYYIGCHWGPENDGYIASSKWLKNSYKRRPDDFKRRILSRVETNRNDLHLEEYRWISMIKNEELGKKYYNLKKWKWKYEHWASGENVEIIKEKMSKSRIGVKKTHSEEARKKMSEARIGIKFSEETKKRMSEARKNMSKENRKKLSDARIGIKRNLSEESRRKMFEANLGKKMSEETKSKISKTKKEKYLKGEQNDK